MLLDFETMPQPQIHVDYVVAVVMLLAAAPQLRRLNEMQRFNRIHQRFSAIVLCYFLLTRLA